MRLYAIYDKKAMSYGEPIMAVNDAVMCRTIKDVIAGAHPVARYPEDYDLYALGDYDVDTGKIDVDVNRVFVCNLSVVLSEKGS